MSKLTKVYVFDTTLRDGSQMEGITFSAEDKKEIISRLDSFGVDFIEGGMPQSNPTDAGLFESSIETNNAKMVAFGSTCRPGMPASQDRGLIVLSKCQAPWICLFGKTWKLHIDSVLRISPEDNLALIRDSISFLVSEGKRVIFDAEHYFDGYNDDPEYALKVVETARSAGAEWVTLCDTNGGTLPTVIGRIVSDTKDKVDCELGIHCHNDSDLAVACTLAAVDSGARLIQGTINGIGERCGNANLCSVIPDLMLKMGYDTNVDLSKLTSLSRTISEICNLAHNTSMPYVGSKAFTHKGGMHIDALLKNPITYEHISPESVGNRRNYLVSEQSGRAGIIKKLSDLNIKSDDEHVDAVLERIKHMEAHGYQFEGADASLELLIRRECDSLSSPFRIPAFRIYIDEIGDGIIKSEASIKVSDLTGEIEHTASDGDGPVDALNRALRKALTKFFPEVGSIRLIDYKVRVLDEKAATAAPVRVMIKSTDGKAQWTTVGVSTNVIEASLIALVDSMEYVVLRKTWRES